MCRTHAIANVTQPSIDHSFTVSFRGYKVVTRSSTTHINITRVAMPKRLGKLITNI